MLEMLVSISVVLLLYLLILPALGKAKQISKATFCSGNLRQWGIATYLYSSDHDDYLPPEGQPNPDPTPPLSGWYVQLPSMLGITPYYQCIWRTNAAEAIPTSTWLCPANTRRSNGRNLFHYCLNQAVNGTGSSSVPLKLSMIAAPSKLIWLFDSKNLPAAGRSSFTHTNLHSGGANFLMLDGHVERLHSSKYWDPTRNRPKEEGLPVNWEP